jgi:MoxR-like ATPases
MDIQEIRSLAESIRGEVRKAVIGQEEVVELMLTSLLVGGHILLEGVPGTAKTLLTQAFAASLRLDFGRIQFTPDLMPGDVLGTNLFNFQTNGFILTKGPIFTQLLLADEINRTPPKTQAALLQAMNERVVTIDGQDHQLGENFMVVATQNPIEQQGLIRCPRPSSTASCSRSSSTIPAATRSGRSCAAMAIAPPCRGWRISAWNPSPTAPSSSRCAGPSRPSGLPMP